MARVFPNWPSRFAALLLGLFALLAAGVVQNWAWLLEFDAGVLYALYPKASPAIVPLIAAVSLLGSGWVLVPFTIGFSVWLWRTAPRHASFMLVSVGGSILLFLAVVFLFDRSRPDLLPSLVSHPPTPSFPSGHVMNSTVVLLTLCGIVRRLYPAWLGLVGGISVFLAVVIGSSRLLLQLHYPSDVVAGLASGVAWALLINGLYWRCGSCNDPYKS